MINNFKIECINKLGKYKDTITKNIYGNLGKMKCSICKQIGHNMRSCNKILKGPACAAGIETYINVKPLVSIKMPNIISRQDAENSADEWVGVGDSPMRTWLVNAIIDPKQHRDIGKVLAYVAEIHVNKWLSEKTGRPIRNVVGEPYDGITDDDKPIIRNQIKFRMDKWHFETTRRNSIKNAQTNGTGHVAYKIDEFDMLAIFIPGPTFGIKDSKIRCLPVSALVNPKKPDQLITSINENIRKLYNTDEKTDEVINLLYHKPSSLLG